VWPFHGLSWSAASCVSAPLICLSHHRTVFIVVWIYTLSRWYECKLAYHLQQLKTLTTASLPQTHVSVCHFRTYGGAAVCWGEQLQLIECEWECPIKKDCKEVINRRHYFLTAPCKTHVIWSENLGDEVIFYYMQCSIHRIYMTKHSTQVAATLLRVREVPDQILTQRPAVLNFSLVALSFSLNFQDNNSRPWSSLQINYSLTSVILCSIPRTNGSIFK
jgi:hypothetical protein